MRDGGKGDKPRPIADRQTYSDNWDKIFKEKDGSLTVNLNGGEINVKEPMIIKILRERMENGNKK